MHGLALSILPGPWSALGTMLPFVETKASDSAGAGESGLSKLYGEITGAAQVAHPLFRPANDNGACARAERLKENLTLLADLDPETDDPMERETNRVMNAVSIERLEREIAATLADKEILGSLANESPLFKAFAALYDQEPGEAEKELKRIGREFPEAKAVADQIENQRRRAVNENALEIWDNFIDEGLAASLGAKNSAAGLALDFIPWLAGQGNGIDRAHAKFNTQKDLLSAVRRRVRQEDGPTLTKALTAISQESGPLKAAAMDLLAESRNRGWGPGYRANAIGFLVGYTEALNDGDSSEAQELARHLFENADHLTVMDGAGKSAYGLYALLHATSENNNFRADCAAKMKEIETGDKSVASLVWDEIRTSGTDTIASLALTGGAVRLGRLAQAGSLAKLHQMGVTGSKALILSYGAGFGVEAHALFGMNTLYQAATSDVSKVFTLDQLKKAYVMNLISLGLMKGFGTAGGALGKKSSPVRQFVLKHGFYLGGSIAGNQINRILQLAPQPKGGTKEAMVKDVFGYLKYAAASKAMSAKPSQTLSEEQPFLLTRVIPTHRPFLLTRKAVSAARLPSGGEDATNVPKTLTHLNRARHILQDEPSIPAQGKQAMTQMITSVSGLIEFYNHPYQRRLLEGAAKRSDAFGSEAKKFAADLNTLEKNIETWSQTASGKKMNRHDFEARQDFWIRDVMAPAGRLMNSAYFGTFGQAMANRLNRVRADLRPVNFALSQMEVATAKNPSNRIQFEIRYEVPKAVSEIPMMKKNPQFSLYQIPAKDFARIEIRLSRPEQMSRVLGALKAQGLVKKEFTMNGREGLLPLEIEGRTVEVPIRFEINGTI